MIEVRRYVTESGTDIVGDWLRGLADARARAKVEVRLARVKAGNLGDCKPVGEGVWVRAIESITRWLAGRLSSCYAAATSERRQPT